MAWSPLIDRDPAIETKTNTYKCADAMTEADNHIRQSVRESLARVLPDRSSDISDDDDFFAMGLDSVSTLLLITELENQYSITLAAEDIPYDQIRTINGFAAFISTTIESQARHGTDT